MVPSTPPLFKPLISRGILLLYLFINFVKIISDEIREKLQNIIRGTLLKGQGDCCTTIRNLLSESFETGPTVKSKFQSRAIIKEKQAHFLKSYAEKASLWMESLPQGCEYMTRGGEPGQNISIAL